MRYRKTGGKCQFVGVLKEAVAVILSHSAESTQEGIWTWMREQSERHSGNTASTNDEWTDQLRPWMGSSIVQGEVEMSGLCWLFCSWAPESIDM